ncbi:MAG: hypothetical protein K9J37_21540 [Saprospiraceae bacterium]|nr:hypothetical protein [Saprospiraceae bacterium]MCF8252506.1 hypothetical protein [Saprospiraceae bacterium]MCF8282530.1 hypothetical protein [Bacteroidales bacterium]MCF8314105.1 hypothetical protein [Saprospiraceae bacterium]MCF8442860.1 hypothetical protein [Saprospiraceae bacterium]
MENQKKNKLAKWLDKIQQDSWQLELVVSGFSIFLMLGALEALSDAKLDMNLALSGMGTSGNFISVAWGILMSASLFVLINLVLHVIMRGLWISAIGLRSVSGDIDFEKLNLAPRFDSFIRRKTVNFDTYIERLENLCSIVFAFTFLIVFVIISVGAWVLLLGLTTKLGLEYLPKPVSEPFIISGYLIIVISGFIYMLDFITLGWVKRRKWFSRIYYPIYRFYGIITLAGLYRPMYYNLIDNKLGRRAGFLLIPYIMLTFWLMSLRIDSHIWFPEDIRTTGIRKSLYDDMRPEKSEVGSASLPSKYVKNGFADLFIRYFPSNDDAILATKCPEIKPSKTSGFGSDIVISVNGKELAKNEHFPAQSLDCFASIYEVSINDSILQQPKFRFLEHPNLGEMGLLCILDVQYLPRGEHEILVRKLGQDTTKNSEALLLKDFIRVPFWKE